MKKIIFIVAVIAMLLLGIYASIKFRPNSTGAKDKIVVITTLFPLYDFSQIIGGEKAEVSLLLPPGVEPHSFEPKPSDIAKISKADVFVYTGEFMEPWAQDIIKGISNKNIIVVDSSVGVNMISASAEHEEHGEHEHHHSEIDPHIWLDFDNVKIIVDNITAAFCERDPAGADFYKQNADEYKNKLAKLDEEYKTSLTNCKTRTIIYGGHYAFGYLAHRYDLQYLAAQGLSHDTEPTAQDLIALVEQIRKNNIHYVFYEELTSPKIAETLANETDAKLLLLNDGANISRKDVEGKDSFVSIMENNLKNLKTGLECD